MKKFTKFISAVLVLATVMTLFLPVTASAFVSEDNFQNYLNESKGLYLAPGADDTEMYFSWYGGKEGVNPTVLVSTNKDMSNPMTFTGTIHSSAKVERSNHVVASGLEKGKTYYYICKDGTTDTEVNFFSTVGENADFSAMYVSDIHVTGSSYDDAELYASSKRLNDAMTDAVKRQNLDLILAGGDQATEGQPAEYFAMLSEKTFKNIPFAMAIGNHDVKRYTYDTIANYPNTKTNNVSKSLIHGDYYFVKGNALFLVIDSTNSSALDHYLFVKNAVRENPDVKWKILMFHHDLFGGHNPSRDSENKLHQALITPIVDKFQIDLVLTGHSHCYSQSHVIYKREVVQNTTGLDEITDPKGTIYLTNGSLRTAPENETPIIFDSDRKSEYIDTDCLSFSKSIYSILDFTEDSLTIKSYLVGEEEAFNSFTINKTTNEGGHPENHLPLWFVIGKYIGTIYNFINNISRKLEISERG